MDAFITWLEGMNAKLPAIPAKGREFLVKIAPYLVIVCLLFTIQGLLALFSFTSYIAFMGFGMYNRGLSWFWIFMAVEAVLYILAISPLFRRSITGWNYLFYATLISALMQLVGFNIIGLVIGLAISLYLLFQVRPYYTGHAHIHSSTQEHDHH